MECNCDNCCGTGTIRCPDCDGSGSWDGRIENITLEKSMHNYDELVQLQKDANRVIRQANTLVKLNPSRSNSYEEQLKATLDTINKQAERTAKRK